MKVSRAKAMLSFGTPAAVNRSVASSSIPQVMGLTKLSGGGGV
jgi:hypothetical protein